MGGRGRKRADPGVALRFVVDVVNHVLEAERDGVKDEVDESVLRGMEWAGHALRGRIVLPRHLRSDYTYKKRERSPDPPRRRLTGGEAGCPSSSSARRTGGVDHLVEGSLSGSSSSSSSSTLAAWGIPEVLPPIPWQLDAIHNAQQQQQQFQQQNR
ncbi:hypothetical protein HK101_004747, partial [Irineochytrium annulatum]